MGMFIKFECDTCGQYECDCSMEDRNKNSRKGIVQGYFKYSIPEESYNQSVCQGDIITSGFTEDKRPINQLYVKEITQDNKILVEDVFAGTSYIITGQYWKLCAVMGEYDKL